MEVDIENMTLNLYLMYEVKQRDLTRNCISRKRGGHPNVAPMSIIGCLLYTYVFKLLNLVSNLIPYPIIVAMTLTFEEYERYELAMSKRKIEVDIDNMTKEEYELYMAM
ncbi:hypothetical protein Tco_0554814 [Tanacetum coccineum]